jgi:hypothetical protein
VKARLRREAPFLLGLVLGMGALWMRGRAFEWTGQPLGPDWHQYFMATWKLARGVTQDYPVFRLPLYPWVLGVLGARTGYSPAAVFLSSLSCLTLVGAAALLARALAGRWAGALAAVAVPSVATTLESTRWAAQYPFLAALTGLGLAAGAAAVRWPGLAWPALAGLGSGLCWVTDGRGLVVVVLAAVLVLLGTRRGVRGWAGPLLFALGAAVGPAAQWGLQVVPRPSTTWLLQFQRGQTLDDIQRSSLSDLAQVCGQGFLAVEPLRAMGDSCGRALLAHNFGGIGPELPCGVGLSVAGLLLALAPGRAGWRGVAASGVVFGGTAVALAFAASLALLPGRYVLQFAAPAAALLPVALVRLSQTAPRGRSVVPWLAVAGAAWLLVVGPRLPPTRPGPVEVVRARLLAEVRARVAPEDQLLDCSHNLKVEVALLPAIHHPDPAAFGEAPDPGRCQRWARGPDPGEGARWLITDQDRMLAGVMGREWHAVARVEQGGEHGVLWRWGE